MSDTLVTLSATPVEKQPQVTYRDSTPGPCVLPQLTVDTQEKIAVWLSQSIHKMDVPLAYLGDEPNTWLRDWQDTALDFKICLVGAMSYASSEGNLAVPLIYSQLNHSRPQYITERSYFPNSRKELALFKEEKVSFFSLENKRPLKDFDVLAFSVSYIMPYMHLAPMLVQSGIAPWAHDRKQEDPIVMVGGCMSFVCEILAGGRGGVYDLAFIGESEDGMEELLDDIRKQRQAGVPRREMLLDLQRRYGDRGVYCPQFYDVEYDTVTHEIVRRVPLEEGLPERITKAYVKNLNEGFMLTDPFMSFQGGMSLGQLEIARGCSNACSFCQEGTTYRPYRERDISVVIPKMKEMVENVGSVDVVPASFTASDHHQINMIIKRLLEEVTDKVSIISQRASAFGKDPTFAWLTGLGGSHTVSVGVEGISQRMRDRMSKGITEADILATVEYALKAGYRGIKLFMITNVPGTVDADYEELLLMLDKLEELRQQYNPKCEIKLSFTPLFISAFTAFQWHKTTIDDRTLTPWIKKIKEKGFGFRLGSGARRDEAYLSQLFHLGDRRITSIMVKDTLENGYVHFGGTSKGTIERWQGFLAEKGLSFDHYFQQKHENWNFSWDFVNTLTSKASVWMEFQKSCQDRGRTVPCIEECNQCGACDKEIWLQRKGWNTAKEKDAQAVGDLDKIKIIRQSGTVQRARLRVEIDPLHRYVEQDHWRMQIRRACYKTKLPLDKKQIAMASDLIKMANWISGVDYIDVKLTEHMFDAAREICTSPAFNQWLRGAKVTDCRVYSEMKGMRTIQDLCLYEMATQIDQTTAQDRINWFLSQTLVTDVIPNDGLGKANKVNRKVKSDFIKAHPTCGKIKRMGYMGVERVIVDFRALVDDMWLQRMPDGTLHLRMTSRGEVTPYDIHQLVFKKKWTSGYSLPAARLEFLLASNAAEDQDDFFNPRCEVCGKNVEQNLFGDPVHPTHCLRHQPWDALH